MYRGVLCGCALACVVAPCAVGDVVGISGNVPSSTEQTGCTLGGTISYSFGGGSSGSVVISLTNTTPAVVGGYLTGFVFNLDSIDAGATAILTSTTNVSFLDTGTESAAPFGTFDAGAALGANWLGGGSPVGGIAVGQSATFTFAVSASDAASLSAMSFLTGPNDVNFVARFRGLANGGSDKVPVVPAPGALALGVLGTLPTLRRNR